MWVHVVWIDVQPACYLLYIVLQVPETVDSGAQLDKKTSVADPLEGNRECISFLLSCVSKYCVKKRYDFWYLSHEKPIKSRKCWLELLS